MDRFRTLLIGKALGHADRKCGGWRGKSPGDVVEDPLLESSFLR